MTKTEILKQFFKKFYNVDAKGKGTGAVLNDIIKNNETLGGGGSSGSSGVMVISATYDEQTSIITLNKTWQEIYDALREGVLCITQDDVDMDPSYATVGLACGVNASNDGYYVQVLFCNMGGIRSVQYTADVADGYPSAED